MLGAQVELHARLRAETNACAISLVSSRSWFFEKLKASKIGSSIANPANQQNNRSNSSRLTNGRSERIECKTATGSRAAGAPAQSRDERPLRKAPQTPDRVPRAKRSPVPASRTTGVPWELAPRRRRQKAAPRSSDPARASNRFAVPSTRKQNRPPQPKIQRVLQQPARRRQALGRRTP